MKKTVLIVLAVVILIIGGWAAVKPKTGKPSRLQVSKYELVLQKVDSKRHAFNTGKLQQDAVLYANDFDIKFTALENTETSKIAGAIRQPDGGYMILEQDDHTAIAPFFPGMDSEALMALADEINGGIKQLVPVNGIRLGLLGMIIDGCYQGLLVNFDSNNILMRMPCLPDVEHTDFNGMGGGYSVNGDYLYLAVGVPEAESPVIRALAQDPNSPYGKVLRLPLASLDGSDEISPEIYSMGHRNPQGLEHVDGGLYLVEHGPKGGDEINKIRQGANYGWPLVSLGTGYDDVIHFRPDNSPAMQNPLYSFVPSIGISDIVACPGIVTKRYAPLGCVMVASLRENSLFLVLLDQDRQRVQSIEKLPFEERIREIVSVEEDAVIFATDGSGLWHAGFNQISVMPDTAQ